MKTVLVHLAISIIFFLMVMAYVKDEIQKYDLKLANIYAELHLNNKLTNWDKTARLQNTVYNKEKKGQ